MANTVSLSIDVSITDTGVLNDESVFTDPIRASTAVYIKAFKVTYQAVQTEITITGNDADPTTDSSWAFDIETDGWYQFYYVSVPNYGIGTTYAKYDVVYDTVSGDVYQSTISSNIGHAVSDPLYWTLVPDPAVLAEAEGELTEPTNADIAIYQRVLTPKVDRLYGDKAVEAARECCSDCDREEAVDAMEVVFDLREGALISEERLEYADGEKMVRRLDEFFTP